MDFAGDFIRIYFFVNIIVSILVVLWMIMILSRLGEIRDFLSSVDRQLAGGMSGQATASPGSADAQLGKPQTQGLPPHVKATFNYQGMKIEETTGGGYILHSSDGFEHFNSRDELQNFLTKRYPSTK
ncbi:hypothetical protein LB577_20280 [Mesorhizobium sp. B283B1A]|uniref:Uncharacterized protein n=3 Tax=Mesorhizobium TaxID=68287 RepID=L0KVA7_MESAW|nr:MULTISPECIES: hypothetical protein [Mesorhizobium]ADV14643.1 hypothetical protein Mesci_5546 [Mesorhizobium ciceri biovar biserrulae WSM1271]AEH90529.1 hypothetical protein Mesop_6128 [Mesorhizobium opportunistum WSM2075]AGB47899.1 hypothetical protein Mesau_05595 [Mesorhizobium australicum WSM2073]MCA0049261.1 hypothetical protein [Mesorhizobium sp. B283B1A]OBP89998.1 hypothetical protein BAE40_13965 [Mesorhizobium loti]